MGKKNVPKIDIDEIKGNREVEKNGKKVVNKMVENGRRTG